MIEIDAVLPKFCFKKEGIMEKTSFEITVDDKRGYISKIIDGIKASGSNGLKTSGIVVQANIFKGN